MASPAPPCSPDTPPTPAWPDAHAAPPCSPDALPTVGTQATLPDPLTEEILLRVPTAADLARASMAGPSLQRVLSDHSFLRRSCSLHPPPLLDILSDSFVPAQPPHPSAAVARSLIGTDFSCSFLPSGEQPWDRCDFRDGRALLCDATDGRPLARDIAVCDPLHRRYQLLPPLPQDLSDLVYDCEPFIAPAGRDEGADIAADAPFRFRVMCLAK
uniref:F-box domain-containing protein n=1 Tax=Aegilops tauschii TaxID=37682 RepID=M8B1E6_AEGTA